MSKEGPENPAIPKGFYVRFVYFFVTCLCAVATCDPVDDGSRGGDGGRGWYWRTKARDR